MGLVKSEWMDAQERGWSPIDKFVCFRCVDNPALKELLRAQAQPVACDYCGKKGAAPVEVLQEAVYETIWTYYHEPADAGVPWDGGYIIEPVDTEEVFYQLGLDGHQELLADILEADMGGSWVAAAEGHWASAHEHEVMLNSWESFAGVVKHQTRFHFGRLGEAPAAGSREIEPGRMLAVVGERLRPYMRWLDAGTLVYRIRVRRQDESWEPDADALGAPSPDVARAGRMNPAGIPYLYTSLDVDTALHETGAAGPTDNTVFIATFELTKPLLVIDLTQLSAPPSVFELDRKDEREKVLFANGFVSAIAQPVTKNGQEHIEYVPSQVVCEYLAQVFMAGKGTQLGGLIFPSSVCQDGKNLVVFPSERGWKQSFYGVEFKRFAQHRPSTPSQAPKRSSTAKRS